MDIKVERRREQKRISQQKYYQKNKELISEKFKERYVLDEEWRQTAIEASRKYKEEHKEEIAEQKKEYYQKNKEQFAQRAAERVTCELCGSQMRRDGLKIIMWKAGLTEAGTDAILGSFAGEAMTGQVELIAAEAAILGLIMGVKKIKEHHQEKKNRKQDEENARNLAAQQAAEQARQEQLARQQEEARIAEEQRQAELKRQADEQAAREEQARQAEIARQEAERQRQAQIDRDRQANVNRVQQNVNQISVQNNLERSQRIQQMEREQGVGVNGYAPGFDQAMRDLDRQYGGAAYDNQQRMQRFGIGPYFAPPDNDPNGGDGPGGDPNNPDGYDEYLRERDQEIQREMFDPFFDMIQQITKQIATNAFNDRQKKEDQKQDDNMPGKGGSGTWKPEYQPDSRGEMPDSSGEQQQQTTDIKPEQIDYNDELHLMEYEMSGIIEGLSQQELTLEQSFVELEKIEQTIKQKIPEQVRVNPTQIYSSAVATF